MGDICFRDPVLGEQHPWGLASQEHDLWECSNTGRSGLRPAQFTGEGVSGHIRGGQQVDAARLRGRDTCWTECRGTCRSI
eukprot:3229166-Pyramimonas_sp.AAC.1